MPSTSPLITASAVILTATLGAQDPGTLELRDIDVETRGVFTDEEAEGNWFYWLINFLHWTTDPEVVRRELWFGSGDRISLDEVAELERNLRRMGLFGEVDAELEDLGDGRGDLRIDARDKFSLILRGGASFVGGVTTLNAAIGDSNLFGTGKRLVLSASQEGDNDEIGLTYSDPQLFGSWKQLTVSGGTTNEGPFASVDFSKPFKYLADPITYGASFSTVDRSIQYFESGETVASVPEDRIGGRAYAAHGFGPRYERWSVGGDVRVRSSDYSPAQGPDASLIRVPGDTDEFQIGPTVGADYTTEFLKLTQIDTIDFVQDVRLGFGGNLRTAFVLRDEDPIGPEPQFLLEGRSRSAFSPFDDTFLTTEVGGFVRLDDDGTQGYGISAALHAYQTSLPYQTIAASLTYDSITEMQDLQPQLTLGEDNGLRGYPAREFGGTRRTRLNVEDRIFTGIEVLSAHLGLAAFFDVGWVHGPDQGLSLGDAWRSVGAGLRIGSSELFGGRVLRIDVAWPLDDRAGQDFDVSLSVSVGQVFTFFGNAASLVGEF